MEQEKYEIKFKTSSMTIPVTPSSLVEYSVQYPIEFGENTGRNAQRIMIFDGEFPNRKIKSKYKPESMEQMAELLSIATSRPIEVTFFDPKTMNIMTKSMYPSEPEAIFLSFLNGEPQYQPIELTFTGIAPDEDLVGG